MKLPESFYTRGDVLKIGRELLGKVLCTRIGGRQCSVVITETEAYAGTGDRASHAYGGRRTARTEPMYARGGCAYVYLCYGLHHLFNVVTGVTGQPHAILVRAGRPVEGLDTMLARRERSKADAALLAGPGSLARALGITIELSGASLFGNTVWIEDRGHAVSAAEITSGPRVGVGYAGADAAQPWRFRLQD